MNRRSKTRLEIFYDQNIPLVSKIFYNIDSWVKKLLMGENDKRDQEYNLVLLLVKNLKGQRSEYVLKELARLGVYKKSEITISDFLEINLKLDEVLKEYYLSKRSLKGSSEERKRIKLDNLQKIFVLKLLQPFRRDINDFEERIGFIFRELFGKKEFDNYFLELSKDFKLSQNKEIYQANVLFLEYLSSLLSLHDIPHTYQETFSVQIFRNVYGYIPAFNLRTKITSKLYKRIRYDDTLQYGLVKDTEYLFNKLNEEDKEKQQIKNQFELHRRYIQIISDRQFSNVVKSGIFILLTKGVLIPLLAIIHGPESILRSLVAIFIMILIGFIVSKSVIIRFSQELRSFNDSKKEMESLKFDFNDNEPGALRQFLSFYKLYASFVLIIFIYFVLNTFGYQPDEILLNIFLFSILLNSSVNIHKTVEQVVLSLKNVIRINYFILIFLGFAGFNDVGDWVAKRYRDADPILKLYSATISVLFFSIGKFSEHLKSYILLFVVKLQEIIHDVTRAGD